MDDLGRSPGHGLGSSSLLSVCGMDVSVPESTICSVSIFCFI